MDIFIDKSRPLKDYDGVYVVDTKGNIASIVWGKFHYGQTGSYDCLGFPIEPGNDKGNGFDINDKHHVIGGTNDDPIEQDETKRKSTSLENAKKYYYEMLMKTMRRAIK